MGREDLLGDPRFATNPDRVRNRDTLGELIQEILQLHPSRHWLEELEKANVSCCPINELDEVFMDPQVLSRGMKISMLHSLAGSGEVDLIGNPIKMSETPVMYRRPPPTIGEHTDQVLLELLGLGERERAKPRNEGLI